MSTFVDPEWVEPGVKAPDFTLVSDSGEKVKLSSLRGKPVVLYFYPKDDTPGCTKQACAFRDDSKKLARHGAVVLGVSPDDVERHQRFKAKYKLDFPLLCDTDHAVATKYGAWRTKTLYGKKSVGIQRSTFVIGADGAVAKTWKRVQVEGHAAQVLAALGELG